MDRAVFVWVISVVEGSGALGVRMYVYVHLRVPSTGSYSGGLDSCGNVPRQSCRVVLSHMFDVGSTVFGSLLMHFTEVVQCLTIGHVQQAIDVVSLKTWKCGVGSHGFWGHFVLPVEGRKWRCPLFASPLSPEHGLAARRVEEE